ncbi:M61 family metallopeptidase [Lewinella sp. JB7]|uniref:M61 family metallopeptidase n=1 Tax=Lewinella sp. JB7 TaxID=2962887 RepID=UPI0020C9FB14|nr:M61 family peptidase [Lewinella sp. JB7]MCP9235628.1 M61 family peptidase [Lewinella sp. JB7]
MRHLFFALAFLLISSLNAQLAWVADHPGTIVYDLDLALVQQHELSITVTFPAVPTGVFLVRMPQSSPGRYAQHNFAKNVYAVSARSGDKPLQVDRMDPTTWAVTGHDGRVNFTYTLFANGGDGTYSGIDDRKLHLNMPASFPYGDGLNDRPVMLRIAEDQRTEWEVATQLVPLGQRRFAAPNYYYFYDSPTMVGRMMRDEFTVASGERVDTIEVAMIHEGSRETFGAYVDWIRRTVLAQQQVFGTLPAFDYGRYVFLCAYNAWIGGDGMEHRNSTVCSAPVDLAGNEERLIGTVSHEFFHSWNVERIRPAHLEPFAFDHVNMSDELWFAEGFTSYYDDLALARAGILSPADFAARMAGPLNYVEHRPGRRYRNPIEMSRQAPFVDAATANDPTNFDNTYISYYTYGTVLALGLDLELRQRGHTLDELMRLMWRRYGVPEIPYHVRDIQMALEEVSQDSSFAAGWFAAHIYDSQLANYRELLAPYGIELRPARPDSAGFFALRLQDGGEGPEVSGPVFETNPLFDAGLDRGSVIQSLSGKPITTIRDWNAAVGELKIGQTYTIGYRQLGQDKAGRFTAATDPTYVSELRQDATESTAARLRDWIGH